MRHHIYATLIYLLLVTLLSYFVAGAWHAGKGPGKDFSANKSLVEEALDLPWKDFLPVTESERRIIRGLALDKPFLLKEVRCWKTVPVEGAFRFLLDQPEERDIREKMFSAIEHLKAIESGGLADDQFTARYEGAKDDLTTVRGNNPTRWIPNYNLGVLYLWAGQNKAAIRFLEKAEKSIEKYLKRKHYPEKLRDRLRYFEAGIATQYALGIAKLVDEDTGLDGLKHLRRSVMLLYKVIGDPKKIAGPYGQVTSGFSFFELDVSGIQSYALWNDLIAAYLSLPGYAHCPKSPPVSLPDCTGNENDNWRTDCTYRDLIFCRSRDKAEPPYQQSYDDIYNTFYREQGRDEYLLWALSNLVDINVYNRDLNNYPALLFNAALLHIRSGHFKLAAGRISAAYSSPNTDQMQASLGPIHQRTSDYVDLPATINKLRIVVNVLVNKKINTGKSRTNTKTNPSNLRRTFIDLYSPEVVPSFPRVSSLFKGRQEDEVDKWLFIHYWRTLLERGDFEMFEKEYQRLMRREGTVFTSFFINWREEVFRIIGQRAHRKYILLREADLNQEADLVRDYVQQCGYFDLTTRSLFKEPSLAISPLQVQSIAALVCLILLIWWHPRYRLLMRIFTSDHRYARKREKPTSFQNNNP